MQVQPDGKFITNLFATNVLKEIPAVVCHKVVAFVEDLLKENGMTPSTSLHTRTVRGTVETITAALGVPTWDIQASHGGANGHSTGSHARVEWTRVLYAQVER